MKTIDIPSQSWGTRNCFTSNGFNRLLACGLIFFSYSINAQNIEVMSWVPPYAISQSQTAAQADFGICDAVDGLTRVGLQFWTPNFDGTIKYANHEFYTPQDSDVTWWKNWGATNNIEIFLTVYNNTGSWDWNLARSAFATNQSTFITQLIAELDRLDLDGIDLDLEGIGSLNSDRASFDQFVHNLWLQLQARGKKLTINSFHYIWNAPNQDWWSDWLGEVDNIHSMGYDDLYEGGTSYQPYSFQQQAGVNAGYARNIVSMGMPSYLSSWGVSSGRGTSAQAHLDEVRYDLVEPTGIAIWDMQLSQWQNSGLWCEIQALKELGTANQPDSPSQLIASTFSSQQIDLDWLDNADNELGYTLERSSDGGATWSWLTDLSVDSSSYSDTGLASNTNYSYRSFAFNADANSSYSNTNSAQTFGTPRIISFSGLDWVVRNTDVLQGPGPNLFSDKGPDVWLDSQGRLHMKISYRDGNWYSSEVYLDHSLGYGTYRFALSSHVDTMDHNAVLGLFTWDTYAPEYNYREIDIEFTRWGDAQASNSQYVVQPWDTPENIVRWETTLSSEHSTHAFTWESDQVQFTSHHGLPASPGSEIQSWLYTGADVPPAAEGGARPHINLWLTNGNPPILGQDVEVIIDSFEFTPLGQNNPPMASFTHSCSNLVCSFSDTSTDDGSLTQWSWDFGNSSTSAQENPSHTFSAAGTYTVSLTVTDDQGASDSINAELIVSEPATSTAYTANTQALTWGNVVGSYSDTHYNDGVTQTITESVSGGKPSRRYSRSRFDWLFDIQSGLSVTLYANIWMDQSIDNDQFLLSYSSNGSSFIPMFQVTADSDQGYQTFSLPASSQGQLTIRVEDTDNTQGNTDLDSVYIDHLYIQTQHSSGNTPPAAPDNLLVDSVTASSVNLQWQDQSSDEQGFYLERSVDQATWSRVLTMPSDIEQATDTGLLSQQLYYFRIQAYNTAGDSGYSNVVSATTSQVSSDTAHIGDLDATVTGNKKWTAHVDVLTVDQSSVPILGATVSGSWQSGGNSSCLTDGSGRCGLSKRQKPSSSSDTFTLTSITHADYTYDSALNTDPDSDSNGTFIIITK